MKFDRRQFLTLTAMAASSLAPLPALAKGETTMEQIKKTKKLRIGVTSAEPWFFKNPMSGKWTGVGVDMGQKLAERLGVSMVPVETTWANCVAALQANQIDIMFVLDPTPERRNAIAFPSAPLFYYAMGALVHEDADVKNWDDIDQKGKTIGVTLGTSLDKNVSAMMKSAKIERFSTNDESVAAFAAHRVDTVVQFHPALVVQYARLKLGKVVLPKPVKPVATSAGMRKEPGHEFQDWVSKQFAELYKAGVPDKVFDAYLKSKGINPSGIPGLIKEDWS